MKKFCLVMVLFTYAFFQRSLGIAAYVISLKNGQEIAAGSYWNEGHEVKLRLRDGIIGIPRSEIISITERDVEIDHSPIYFISKEPASEGSNFDDKDSRSYHLEKRKILREKQTAAWDDYLKMGDRSSEERRQARKKAMEIDRQLKELERKLTP